MFLENLKRFIIYYGKERYLKLVGFTILSFIAGCLEFIGIALIYPFIMLIIQPDMINVSKYIKIENTVTSGLLIGLAVLLIFIFKNAFIILSQYIQNKFVFNWKQEVMNKFMKYYLFASYKDTMKIAPNDKIYTLETLCGQSIDVFLMRTLNLITNIIIVFMVVLLLFIKFPIPAIITIIFICVAMCIQNKFFKKRTSEIAEVLAQKYHKYQMTLLENINNIKDIKILSSENKFYQYYKDSLTDMKEIQIRHGFYSAMPPYIIEILVVSSLMLMACILSIQHINSNSALIASFAIVVASLFRIAPALNRIQSAIIAINTSRNFVKMLNNEHEKYEAKINYPKSSDKKIHFSDKIEFKNINFSYNDSKNVIKNLSFEIKRGDFIGIIGLSGAGKSTLADIITGLLPIDSGEILIDGLKLTAETFPQFRKLIGYVPQQINILDKSVKENIAWGCDSICETGVIKALKAAQIYEVIEESGGIDSKIFVGSNGLSQGQKQRLAIARALYRDPEILLFDEATSALDVQVENEITEMLSQIGKSKTIIAIAHRLSTLKACNKLIYMKDGQIVDIGTFSELSMRYEEFKKLLELSKIE